LVSVPLQPSFTVTAADQPILPDPQLAAAGAVADWMDTVALVRPALTRLVEAMSVAELLTPGTHAPTVAGQQPRVTTADGPEPWCATGLPAGDRTTVVYLPGPGSLPQPGDAVTGLVFDQWVELVPARSEVAGITFGFDAPSNSAPQSWLLAVTPPNERWSLDMVLATLRQTLDWTRYRAVVPEDLTAFGRAVPSVFTPGTVRPWSAEEVGA
jgi:hypothetical protein